MSTSIYRPPKNRQSPSIEFLALFQPTCGILSPRNRIITLSFIRHAIVNFGTINGCWNRVTNSGCRKLAMVQHGEPTELLYLSSIQHIYRYELLPLFMGPAWIECMFVLTMSQCPHDKGPLVQDYSPLSGIDTHPSNTYTWPPIGLLPVHFSNDVERTHSGALKPILV